MMENIRIDHDPNDETMHGPKDEVMIRTAYLGPRTLIPNLNPALMLTLTLTLLLNPNHA